MRDELNATGGSLYYLSQRDVIEGLAKAKAYTMENTKRGMKFDMVGAFPMGPVGRPVMFVGSSLQAEQWLLVSALLPYDLGP